MAITNFSLFMQFLLFHFFFFLFLVQCFALLLPVFYSLYLFFFIHIMHINYLKFIFYLHSKNTRHKIYVHKDILYTFILFLFHPVYLISPLFSGCTNLVDCKNSTQNFLLIKIFSSGYPLRKQKQNNGNLCNISLETLYFLHYLLFIFLHGIVINTNFHPCIKEKFPQQFCLDFT